VGIEFLTVAAVSFAMTRPKTGDGALRFASCAPPETRDHAALVSDRGHPRPARLS